MPSRSTSTRGRSLRGLVLATAIAVLALTTAAPAFEIIEDPVPAAVSADSGDTADVASPDQSGLDLYLAISINGTPRQKVVAVRQETDGSLWMTPADLTEAGIAVPKGYESDELVALATLADVTYSFDEALQSIDFTATETARARLIIDADGDDAGADLEVADEDVRSGDFGLVLNYDLYAGASLDDGGVVTSPVSGAFEARLFGPLGLIDQTFAVLSDHWKIRRLETTWSMSDQGAMRTYRAGDVVTGALSWTRPTRLGGVQVQNDFGLRSDVITYPVPSITGSAALPSTVDIYVNNTARYSSEVPEGPFEIVDLPVLTGAGTIELVVHDAAGNRVVTKADYFSSPSLLKPGLVDYSAEIGFARTSFATDNDRYDRRLMGSASIRTGVTDWLTWEGHAEGGLDLINVGTGTTLALGRLGLGQFSVAGSRTPDAVGLQVAGSLQLSFGPVSLGARSQRSFGRYEDIASVTAPGTTDHTSPTPSSLYQVSLSLPTPFEGGRANLSYTQSYPSTGNAAQIVAASYGQKLFAGTGSATAYMDLKSKRYGMAVSLSMPIGHDMSARTSVRHTDNGTSIVADVASTGGTEIGDVDWLVRVDKTKTTDMSAVVRSKLPVASIRAKVAHRGDSTSASAQLSGAIIAGNGGVFLANRIDDAFAVVDAGAPGVPVLYQNRVVGVTGANGTLVVPGLIAYEKNRISIDPRGLPLDRVIENTTAVVVPVRGSGVVVSFGKHESGGMALVTFRDESGEYLPLASEGSAGGDAPQFVVGYDGAALLEDLAENNIVTITLPDGTSCIADVSYAGGSGDMVNIDDVVCHAVS